MLLTGNMVSQPSLLQLIQFVGLITPALAILTELLVSFHGGLDSLVSKKNIPFEVQILFLGFGAILLGGMIIGIQFGLRLDDPVTQVATFLIFGGLPFLAIAVLVMNVRLSGAAQTTTGIADALIISTRKSISVAIPIILTVFVYFYPILQYQDAINRVLNWWIFHNGLSASWYFSGLSILLLYKLLYALWIHDIIPAVEYGTVLEQWFIVLFTLTGFLVLLVLPVFGVYYFLIQQSLPYVTATSPLAAVPFIWGVIVVVAVLYTEIDPNTD